MIFSISDNFIKRPVLTTVCTIVILLLGGVCIPLLPIEYVPQIAPYQVQVTATYTGADPETIETTVTTPIERKLNTTPNLAYMTSTIVAGNSQTQAFFDVSTDSQADQVNIQNNLAQALPLLPTSVQQQGVVTQLSSSSILRVYGFYSPDNTYDAAFISNYVDLYVNDPIARIPGVAQINLFGQLQYAMRFWVNPEALAARSLTMNDVISAVKNQNVVLGGGAIGGSPVPAGQDYQIPLKLDGMFTSVADAENLVVKTTSNGTLIQLKDVGRVELGAQSYGSYGKVNGKPGIGMVIYQLPGSNAVDLAEQIESTLKELEADFPPGLKAEIVYDTVSFIRESTKEVILTLLEAIFLVILVIFVFLQDWRTTIIPSIAIPVSLIGAMIFAKLLGFSINSLTMFGLVLATGLVVDDGIVVVEAIVAKMETQRIGARQASLEAMGELSGAVIAISLVLMAVFVPVAFFPGATGLLYKQFALIIAFSIGVSVFNALSFSPSMSAILLRPPQEGERRDWLGKFFNLFNRGLTWIIAHYVDLIRLLIRIRYIVLAVFVAGLAATVMMFRIVPTGFVPLEDQGALLGLVQGPDISSVQYTNKTLDQVQQVLQEVPEIDATFTASGISFSGNVPNRGIFFAHLKPWDERTKPGQSVDAIIKKLNLAFVEKIPRSVAAAFNPPAIPGFNPQGGFNMNLLDTTGGKISFQEFQKNAAQILKAANENPVFGSGGRAYTLFSANTPQYEISLDRDELNRLDIDFNQALSALSASIGSTYVNQFVYGPRFYQVYVQADGEFRNHPEDLKQIYVKTRSGSMVSLDQVLTIKPYTGPAVISHFNEYRTILLQGNQSPEYSSGQAIQAISEAYTANALPGVKYAWSDLTRQQVAAGSLGPIIFLFGIIMVFLVLSAQYESYIDPTIILLTVPLAILGALGAIALRHLVNDVYCNIALVMLIGLASKNAILIVEFANQGLAEGKTIVQAALTACQERFRPIIMTAFAALVGFYPLVVATGAGANARHSLGTAVFGGLLVSTLLSLLIVPVLYVVIKTLQDRFTSGTEAKKSLDTPDGKSAISKPETPSTEMVSPPTANPD